MTTKEYLKQAFYLDKRINSKLEQLSNLNVLATKTNTVLSGLPKSPSRGNSKLEETIVKIIDLQEEINSDINALVDLKRDIAKSIRSLKNKEEETVLERRYLCFQSWEQIAVDLSFDIRHIHRLHSRGLRKILR